ncbi:MAG: Bifunctional NAD(P)H-hydrate repair enzyme Nnr [Syntrophomonadaceae bacterium]|nr:Bifunctional NAD(P)H-hydrate repair enzyme Nnr [Bacillota bacterium]
MKLVNAVEMRKIDRRAMDDFKVSTLSLMENAGKSVAVAASRMLNDCGGKMVVVLAGGGNNGGDGFVAARYLIKEGFRVLTFLLGEKSDVRGAARENLDRLQEPPREIRSEDDFKEFRDEILKVDLLIDALLGTGVKGNIKGLTSAAITLLNEAQKPIISVDVPSGLDADTGKPLGVCVQARQTVTFGLPKLGLFLYPGREFAGEITIVDIGIPAELLTDKGLNINLLTNSEISLLFPRRRGDSHKGDYGHVFILAGSTGLSGAAVLGSIAAIRTGAGLVTLGIPESLNPIMEVKLTEVMTLPLPETTEGSLSPGALRRILQMMEKVDAVALGPGLSTNSETGELLRELLVAIEKPVVLDADGLNLLNGDLSLLKNARCPLVITPHPGEAGRLIGKGSEEVQSDRIGTAREIASQSGAVVVLKGAATVLANSQGDVWINSTGNPGMASGGVGDILPGMIASFIGQGLSEIDAARAAVYIHGKAGDIAAEKVGLPSLIATDIIDNLPIAMLQLAMD